MTHRGIVADPPAVAGANTTARRAVRQPEAHRSAWEREMERAQMADWLAHDPIKTRAMMQPAKLHGHQLTGAGGVSSLSRQDVKREPQEKPELRGTDEHEQTRRLAKALQGLGDVQATMSVSAKDQDGTETHAPAGGRRAQAFELAHAVAQNGAAERASASAAEAGPQSQNIAGRVPIDLVSRPSGSSPASPIRLHADWSADGVRLWLALDVNVHDQMEAIADQLRQWMRGQGVRVLSLVCNGRQLEDAEASSQLANAMNDSGSLFKPKEKYSWPSAQ